MKNVNSILDKLIQNVLGLDVDNAIVGNLDSSRYYNSLTVAINKVVYAVSTNKDMVRRLLDNADMVAYRLLPAKVVASVSGIDVDTIIDAQVAQDGAYAIYVSIVAKNSDAILDTLTDADLVNILNAYGSWVGALKSDDDNIYQVWKTKLG